MCLVGAGGYLDLTGSRALLLLVGCMIEHPEPVWTRRDVPQADVGVEGRLLVSLGMAYLRSVPRARLVSDQVGRASLAYELRVVVNCQVVLLAHVLRHLLLQGLIRLHDKLRVGAADDARVLHLLNAVMSLVVVVGAGRVSARVCHDLNDIQIQIGTYTELCQHVSSGPAQFLATSTLYRSLFNLFLAPSPV